MCFLGFSVGKGEEYCQRSAELGALASLFDLTSDGLLYDKDAVLQFRNFVHEILGPELADLSLSVLNQKRTGGFELDGLYRGVPTLKIIIQHLRAEGYWPNESEIAKAGILCQIVDDIVDYRDDLADGGLNFLRHKSWRAHVRSLMDWDYEKQFSASKYPLVLFQVVKRAKAVATKFAIQDFECRSDRLPSHGTREQLHVQFPLSL